jgi:hypothetical protein
VWGVKWRMRGERKSEEGRGRERREKRGELALTSFSVPVEEDPAVSPSSVQACCSRLICSGVEEAIGADRGEIGSKDGSDLR